MHVLVRYVPLPGKDGSYIKFDENAFVVIAKNKADLCRSSSQIGATSKWCLLCHLSEEQGDLNFIWLLASTRLHCFSSFRFVFKLTSIRLHKGTRLHWFNSAKNKAALRRS